jgi:hypothetical protein
MLTSSPQDLGTLGYGLLSDARDLDRSSLHFRRFCLAGLVVDAWFSDSNYADLCAQNLSQLENAVSGTTADLTLFLLDSETVGWPQPSRWAEDVFDRQAANKILSDIGLHGAYLHDPRVWQFFSPKDRMGVQLIRRPGATAEWEAGGPLRVFLHWAFGVIGRRLCHAATLGLEGKGIMLVGAGGSGKSGTTLAGITAGLHTVGDDYCLVEQTERVTAYPLYRILKQDAAGVTRARGASACDEFGPLNWQGKYEIHESQLPHSPFVPSLDIRAIIVPRVAYLPSSVIRPISAGLAMRAFAPSSAFQLPDGEREGIIFTGALCRRLPCMEILLSEDSGEIADTLHNFLEYHLA